MVADNVGRLQHFLFFLNSCLCYEVGFKGMLSN